MKITRTGLKELWVEVYIIDEQNDRELYVKSVKVTSPLASFQLRKDKDELRKVFDSAVAQLEEKDHVKKIRGITNTPGLELLGEFEQYGNYITLRLKIK